MIGSKSRSQNSFVLLLLQLVSFDCFSTSEFASTSLFLGRCFSVQECSGSFLRWQRGGISEKKDADSDTNQCLSSLGVRSLTA